MPDGMSHADLPKQGLASRHQPPVVLHPGDMLDVLPALPAESIHAVVTDPPYHLTSIVKRFGASDAAPAQEGTDGLFARSSRGFMGKQWDGGDLAFRPETWAAVKRVMKPGAHLVAFGGTRTFHRMASAIEDAGFELRDTLMWLYGTGFPKSHNQHGEWEGWGTALKPAWEPIILARKPLAGTVTANVHAHGSGALNIGGCRIGDEVRVAAFTSLAPCHGNALGAAGTAEARRGTQGEPKTYVGRWPANVLHDGSDEVEAAFAKFGERPGQLGSSSTNPGKSKTRGIYGAMGHAETPMQPRGDTGTASRFFYAAKASKADRAGSAHPTVKPVALMRWLVRLVTPPGGIVLDPFAGSGTTAAAAAEEGFGSVLIEREPEYQADIRRRFDLTTSEGEQAHA